MNDAPHPALLPAGLYDLLPPAAEIEAEVTARLMGALGSDGYERLKPPLVEFEETLLSVAGSAMASETFRTMDPISHRMIGVRADMTPQVARIAATRLAHKPRPLRLSYAGQVLRVKGSQMRPERQIGQAGAELIGAGGPAADIEVIAVAGEALAALGVPHLSVDLTLPTLVPAIAEAYGIAGERAADLPAALDRTAPAAAIRLGRRRHPSRRPPSRSTPTRSCAPCPRRRRAAGCWFRPMPTRPAPAPCAPTGGSPSRRCCRRRTGWKKRAGSTAPMC